MKFNRTRKPFSRGRFYKMLGTVLIFTLIFSYIAISIYSTFLQTTSPSRDLGPDTPASYGLSYETVSFPTAAPAGPKLDLRGWFIPSDKSSRVLILVPGQGGKRSDQLPLSKPLQEKGFNLLMLDPRGHGQSDGDHHTFGQYEQWDVVGAVNYLKNRGFQPESIGAMGWSMGAATVVLALGDTTDLKAAVSDSGFADLTTLHGIFSPGIMVMARLFRGIDTTQVKPELALAKLGQRHLFVIHGDQDRNVTVKDAYRFKELGGDKVELWILPGVRHTEAYGSQPDEYISRVAEFFNRELASQTGAT